MTYRELKLMLSMMTAEQLDHDVTVYLHSVDEFMPVAAAQLSNESTDVLDPDHLFLEVV